MPTQSERRAATRQRLVVAARECFVADGYDDVSTERIRRAAGVSRGAMYHHFASKRDLFEAVFLQVSDETIRLAIQHGGGGASPRDQLADTCLAWLREVRRPEAAIILLELAPQVLGWQRARDLEATTSLSLIIAALERGTAPAQIDAGSIELTAHLLNAVLTEAALVADNHRVAVSADDVETVVRGFLTALLRGD